MSSSRSFSRYSNRSSTQSDPSSSIDLKKPDASYALTRSKSTRNDHNLTSMVKKFMEKKPKARDFVVPADVSALIADDFRKKTSIRGGTTGFGGLHKKLFGSRGKGDESDQNKKKKALTLTDVKPNARTLAMVLRSERELLSQNKEQETEITELKLVLEEKNREVDKLKDLCLKQREEIKALKNAILFPEKQEDDSQIVLKQANQIIPSLQRQVTSLTGQLHCLAQDLAEVKADKYSVMGCYDSLLSSPRTPTHEQEEATNSLEFSSGDQTAPGSPDNMFLNDLNPCLTPYAISKSKSKEFESHSSLSYNNNTRCQEIGFGRKLSKSSGDKKYVNPAKNFGRRSDENNKHTYGGW